MIRPDTRTLCRMLFVTGAAAGVAFAAPTVRFADTGGNTNPSDGHLADIGVNGSFDFTTFCVEVAEPLQYGTTYEYAVSTSIKNRGGQGPLSLENATGYAIAFIYQTFREGGEAAIAALSGINGLTDSQYRELAQRTMWNKLYGGFLKGEINQQKVDALWAAAFGKTDSLGQVRVMNVWRDVETQSGPGQDMLILVPLPSGAGLASVGVLGLIAARRRR